MKTCRYCNGELIVENVIESLNGAIETYICQECGREGNYRVDFKTNVIHQNGSCFRR